MTQISPEAQKTLQALRNAVEKTLDRKRRLGHYAVMWQDGKPLCVGEDAPPDDSQGHPEEILSNNVTNQTSNPQ
jgi:hypothetical protein